MCNIMFLKNIHTYHYLTGHLPLQLNTGLLISPSISISSVPSCLISVCIGATVPMFVCYHLSRLYSCGEGDACGGRCGNGGQCRQVSQCICTPDFTGTTCGEFNAFKRCCVPNCAMYTHWRTDWFERLSTLTVTDKSVHFLIQGSLSLASSGTQARTYVPHEVWQVKCCLQILRRGNCWAIT